MPRPLGACRLFRYVVWLKVLNLQASPSVRLRSVDDLFRERSGCRRRNSPPDRSLAACLLVRESAGDEGGVAIVDRLWDAIEVGNS